MNGFRATVRDERLQTSVHLSGEVTCLLLTGSSGGGSLCASPKELCVYLQTTKAKTLYGPTLPVKATF